MHKSINKYYHRFEDCKRLEGSRREKGKESSSRAELEERMVMTREATIALAIDASSEMQPH